MTSLDQSERATQNRDDRPTCWIIAGPNGAGKTTFALEYLPRIAGCKTFVNADLIATGLAPLAPERRRVAAGRVFLREIARNIAARHDFGFETTLAGRTHRRLILRLKAEGWRVEMMYLALQSIEVAKYRVAERVRHGGHGIPQAYPKVTRKLVRGWHGDNERWGCPGRIAGVGVWTGGPGRRRGLSRASPGRAVRRKPIGCGAAGTGGRGATWRCSAGPSGMPPVRAAGGSGWRRARPAGARRSGGSPGGCSRSGRSRARWRSRRC